jgi:hypothetical protein
MLLLSLVAFRTISRHVVNDFSQPNCDFLSISGMYQKLIVCLCLHNSEKRDIDRMSIVRFHNTCRIDREGNRVGQLPQARQYFSKHIAMYIDAVSIAEFAFYIIFAADAFVRQR